MVELATTGAAGLQHGAPTQRLRMLVMLVSVAAARTLEVQPSMLLRQALVLQHTQVWVPHLARQHGVDPALLLPHRHLLRVGTMLRHLPPQRRLQERTDTMTIPIHLLTPAHPLPELALAMCKMRQHRGSRRRPTQNRLRTIDLLNHWMLLHQVGREQRVHRRRTVVDSMHLLLLPVEVRDTWKTTMMTELCTTS